MKSNLRLLLLLGLFLVSACTRQAESPAPAGQQAVSATSAYEKHFGPPPATDKGTCYAFVIYFPSATSPGKALPFPFFTFDQASMKKVAVERLLAGMELPAYAAEISQPFAPGAHLVSLSEGAGVVTVDLSKGFLKAGADEAAALRPLVLTLSQFQETKGIRVLSEGKEVDFARGTQQAVAEWVLDPSPPRLLSVTAMKEKGASGVEEVDVFFDRPVEIESLAVGEKGGAPFAGTTYHSVFDMAAVLKPEDPSLFEEKMPVRVRWKVTDKKGRTAAGDDLLTLEIRQH